MGSSCRSGRSVPPGVRPLPGWTACAVWIGGTRIRGRGPGRILPFPGPPGDAGGLTDLPGFASDHRADRGARRQEPEPAEPPRAEHCPTSPLTAEGSSGPVDSARSDPDPDPKAGLPVGRIRIGGQW